MKIYLKGISLFYVIILCIIFISCRPKNQEINQITFSNQVNMWGWQIPSETIKIHYYGGKEDQEKMDRETQMLRDYLLKEFNVDIRRIVSDISADQRLSLMLASGDYPELITRLPDRSLSQWVDSKRAIELSQLVREYAPNILEGMENLYKLLKDENGQVFALRYAWGYLPITDVSAHVRLDWWEEIGSPEITTPDDFYNALEAMVENHPTNENGEKVYGISWGSQVSGSTKPELLAGFWGLIKGFKVQPDGRMIHWINTEEGYEASDFYNRLHRGGLLDPDAFVNKFEDWKTKVSNERIAGHIGGWWSTWNAGHEVWQKEDPDLAENKRFIQISFRAPQAEKAMLSGRDALGWGNVIITDKAANPEALMRFLDFAASPMGTRLFGWGVPNEPGSVWTTDGKTYEFVEKYKQDVINSTLDYSHTLGTLGQNRLWLARSQRTLWDDNKSNTWFDQNFNRENKWKNLMAENMAATIYDATVYNATYDTQTGLILQRIEDLVSSSWTKTVMSDTKEEFEENYAAMVDTLNRSGVKDLEKFRSAEYRRRKAILEN